MWPCACCRLVDCLLGSGAAARDKLIHGNPLVVLGVSVSIDNVGALCKPDPAKVSKWCKQIQGYLAAGELHAGDASKLAGALQWACQHMFRRLGRAMLRPIFRSVLVVACEKMACQPLMLHIRQSRARYNPLINDSLKMALRWWLAVLEMGIVYAGCAHYTC